MARSSDKAGGPPPLAAEYDYRIYVHDPGNSDLAGFNEEEARCHYEQFGIAEGRVCSTVRTRGDFIALIPARKSVLEIGPFYAPAFKKSETDVYYLDCLSSTEMKQRAETVAKEHLGQIPEIDYIWSGQRYSEIIPRKFPCVFSSHNIEHQPCLITHLHDLESILDRNGRIYLVIPDKRYCFDHYAEVTSTSEVVEAYLDKARRHRIRNVLDYRFFPTHNDPVRHWHGDHGQNLSQIPLDERRSSEYLAEIEKLRLSSDYNDVHAWKFIPLTFRVIMINLFNTNFTNLCIERIYPTIRNSNEFYAVLTRGR